ncbi:hypothetical protein FVR03_15450 [Pontibacter qinzhouensis]|uniref:Uncharacterized protein n=1 Tax=Pontibacter qinzhouensis TaxID=2603253 RepID=A0A5C8JKE9_9BACT|nr:hypothetical protein [Pontibacter qinzhouensis]TXK37403.1 hypothetical protein FVR03_15450 [Pontibacter qinzhouensis]
MKKYFVLFASSILLAASVPTANAATVTKPYTVKKTEGAVQIKEVNSKLIQQLELNENQYIQLKALYGSYQGELKHLKGATYTNSQIDSLTNDFLAEAAKILKPEQLAAYVGTAKSEAVLAKKK